MHRIALIASTILGTTSVAADPQPNEPEEPKGMEFAAAVSATANVEQGDPPGVGAGLSLGFSGTGVWSVGGRFGALWYANDVSSPGGTFSEANHRVLQCQFLVRHRVDRLTLGFGFGLDSHAIDLTRVDGGREPVRSSTYFFGSTVEVSYALARARSHMLELTFGASISPLFDVIAGLNSGELTASDRVFSASLGLGYRYR